MSVRLLLVCLLFGFPVFAQDDNVWLHPNHGQWDARIDYLVDLNSGSMLIGPEGFIYNLNDAQSHNHAEEKHDEAEAVHSHIIRSSFQNVSWKGERSEGRKSEFYRNYFIGKDPSKWQSGIYSVEETTYRNYYDGIDFLVSGKNAGLKYSFIVSPGADPSVIKTNITGSDKVYLKNGELHISNRFGEIIEKQPKAWTVSADGKRADVPVRFLLNGTAVSFLFPEGYDHSAQLVIDPDIVFSTFTGSTRDNWGMTATPDVNGNLYAGGIAFAGAGVYPISTGAMDATFNGGSFDVAITKFNATGTALIYSTYLGGSDNETVHSLVTDAQGHLYVLGVTGSSNFPVTPGCIQPDFNGGPSVLANGLSFSSGVDIYMAHISPAGNQMLGCTYYGGASSDGLNGGGLYYNYGDQFRGEIVVRNGFVYVASSTNSANLPLVNPYQGTFGGSQDALVLKATTDFTSLAWSTYLGGSGFDSGNGIQISETGALYVTGGTTAGMQFPSGHTLSYQGGQADAYLARLADATGFVTAGTFLGTGTYDQSFFVQIDNANEVYIYGQTAGSIPVSPGKYGVANSGQFIAKYNTALTTRIWTTSVGGGSGHVEISPTAFLVSNCNEIYIAGWGGKVNQLNSPGATQSTTFGLPVTPDAYKSTTLGSNFWIAVLGQDATNLKYATFMGGNATTAAADHVDGGTSRFDKKGNIYHAVCAACGGNDNGFPTTPGVYSPTNPSANCNLAAFKFELSTIDASVAAPASLICLPDPVVFQNTSVNGNQYLWNFGDNTTSTQTNPSHVYDGPGTYTVTLIVTDASLCFAPDTVIFQVNIGEFDGGVVAPPPSICPNTPFQFEAFGGATYKWSPAALLNNPNIFNPVATVSETTEFTCIISDVCGVDTVTVTLNVFGTSVEISDDTTICIGNTVPLFVQGGVQVNWTPPSYLDDPASANPVSTPQETITYNVTGTTQDGCQIDANVTITVEVNPPAPVLEDTVRFCSGEQVTVIAGGASSYSWSPNENISTVTGSVVHISTPTDRYYYCDFTNTCATVRDSVFLDVVTPQVTAGNDTIVCPGNTFFMWASGAVNYYWTPLTTYLDPSGEMVSATTDTSTTYTVLGIDENGCRAEAYVEVTAYPKPVITLNPDVYAFMGDEVALSAGTSSPGVVSWSPTEYLSCVVCQTTVATPDRIFEYTATFIDGNGCVASDKVQIFYDPIIYVPNAFTPDGDNFNAVFLAQGGNIKTFRMDIFNRWGELIFTSNSLKEGWDGTYGNSVCPDGVYTWRISYSDFSDEQHDKVGHVSLLR